MRQRSATCSLYHLDNILGLTWTVAPSTSAVSWCTSSASSFSTARLQHWPLIDSRHRMHLRSVSPMPCDNINILLSPSNQSVRLRVLIKQHNVLEPSWLHHLSRDGPLALCWQPQYSCSLWWPSSSSLLMGLLVSNLFLQVSCIDIWIYRWNDQASPWKSATLRKLECQPCMLRWSIAGILPNELYRSLWFGHCLVFHMVWLNSSAVSCAFPAPLYATLAPYLVFFSPADIVGGDVLKLRRMDAAVVCLWCPSCRFLPVFWVLVAHFLWNHWNKRSFRFFLRY